MYLAVNSSHIKRTIFNLWSHMTFSVSGLLRKNQYAVGADGNRRLPRESVAGTRLGDDVSAWMVVEVVIVALPIAVETELPGPCGREADDVAILRIIGEVGNDHDVVRRSALVPAVDCWPRLALSIRPSWCQLSV